MTTLFDYLTWRGDLSFRQSPFNQIDSLILTRFCYLPFEQIVTHSPISIKEAGTIFFEQNLQSSQQLIMQEDAILLQRMMSSRRFSSLMIQHFENHISQEQILQFSALTIHLDTQTSYVAFRGTDLSLVGWKEDFYLMFSPHITAHQYALNYISCHEKDFRKRLIFGGHSKGGHLAIYAGLFASDTIKKKIITIHNFDGPGFHTPILTMENYKKMASKIKTFIPEYAMIGVLLHPTPPKYIVKSHAKGILQHDTFTWQIEGTQFVCTHDTTKQSKQFQQACYALFHQLDNHEKEILVHAIFKILTRLNVTDVRELIKLPSQLNHVVKEYHALNKSDTQLIKRAIQLFAKTIWKNEKTLPPHQSK